MRIEEEKKGDIELTSELVTEIQTMSLFGDTGARFNEQPAKLKVQAPKTVNRWKTKTHTGLDDPLEEEKRDRPKSGNVATLDTMEDHEEITYQNIKFAAGPKDGGEIKELDDLEGGIFM